MGGPIEVLTSFGPSYKPSDGPSLEPMSNNPSIFPFMLTSKPHSKKKPKDRRKKKRRNPSKKLNLQGKKHIILQLNPHVRKRRKKKSILPKDLLFPGKILTDQEKKQKPLPQRKNMRLLVVLNNATLCIPRKGLVVDRSAMIKMLLRGGRRAKVIKSSILSKIH